MSNAKSESGPKSVHVPEVEVQLRSGSVVVKELAYPDALSLYHKLMEQSEVLTDGNGNVVLDAQRIMKAIGNNIELGEWLALKATGKDAEWLKERTLSEVLDVAIEAAMLNISVIVDRVKKARGRFAQLTRPAAPEAEQPKKE